MALGMAGEKRSGGAAEPVHQVQRLWKAEFCRTSASCGRACLYLVSIVQLYLFFNATSHQETRGAIFERTSISATPGCSDSS